MMSAMPGDNSERRAEHPLGVPREHHDEVPRQREHVALTLARNDFLEELAELFRIPVVRTGRNEPDAAVEIPTDDPDAALRLRDRRTYGGEI
jgi:hypothetical protein